MLKIRNLIFAFSLTPLMSLAWQLPSLAQVVGPSKGTAGTASGAQTGGTTTTIFSVPPAALPGGTTTGGTTTGGTTGGAIIPGVSAAVTSGVSTSGGTALTAASVEPTSPSVNVTGGGTTPLVISIPPTSQTAVNQSAAAISQNLNSATTGGGTTGGDTTGGATAADIGTVLTGGAGSQQAAVTLTTSLTTANVPLQLATPLVTSLNGLFSSTSASLPNQPVAQATSGQLVASTKAFKPVIIAQGSAGISVNINKLNDAIVAYNAIVLQGKSEVVKNLSKNSGFRAIGSILKQLRTVIK
ncbi:hypothetical protein [Dolichospermum circinale]|uniref:hypothetical protein n=1 Tax=Dolichospermum circinale TaxID=109265 RepID=UPI0004043F2B|nr:hypothetical protein [Dolichospermum circinale]MDB9484560.1 hypothetical protein [Dolichospermum circinale CS-537/05]MDB9456576.1 hypothetical protein [Dolichospermum circinale CS-541/06]MDB9464387.1 hypothetical protein [Dolichospermum circinale CS-541/04]MDB9474052.1 hypothetical protein [Dolichospermum circinale CS-537/11]MDB9479037.1 hypothetical protein [Dolichospermum circinale CS-537/03]